MENGTTASLQNVQLCDEAMERAMKRASHLPGIVAFYGPSGWGKSFAAVYTANKKRAYYVEAKSSWTSRAVLLAILTEMGIAPAQTRYAMTDQVAEQLVLSRRPLIVDEIDHIVGRKEVELIRDIYEGSHAAILLIGEERLSARLSAWERFHGRVLDWVQAQPASLGDARLLAKLYVRHTSVADDLLARIHELSQGSVRRICINLERVREHAVKAKLPEIGLAEWANRELFTGIPPLRRL